MKEEKFLDLTRQPGTIRGVYKRGSISLPVGPPRLLVRFEHLQPLLNKYIWSVGAVSRHLGQGIIDSFVAPFLVQVRNNGLRADRLCRNRDRYMRCTWQCGAFNLGRVLEFISHNHDDRKICVLFPVVTADAFMTLL